MNERISLEELHRPNVGKTYNEVACTDRSLLTGSTLDEIACELAKRFLVRLDAEEIALPLMEMRTAAYRPPDQFSVNVKVGFCLYPEGTPSLPLRMLVDRSQALQELTEKIKSELLKWKQ